MIDIDAEPTISCWPGPDLARADATLLGAIDASGVYRTANWALLGLFRIRQFAHHLDQQHRLHHSVIDLIAPGGPRPQLAVWVSSSSYSAASFPRPLAPGWRPLYKASSRKLVQVIWARMGNLTEAALTALG